MKSKEILPENERIGLAHYLDENLSEHIINKMYKALLSAENEIQEDKESFLKTIQNREEEIHTHISRVQELEKEIKEYVYWAKNNVPELVRILKERK